MNILWSKIQMTEPTEMIVIVKTINGINNYFTEDGVALDENLPWCGSPIEVGITPPSWA